MMKPFFSASRTLCLVLFLCMQLGVYALNEKPFVIPELKEWKGADGMFQPSADMRIVCGEPALRAVAGHLLPITDRCSALFFGWRRKAAHR